MHTPWWKSLLALVAVSPETVLRARAVGIRGVVVGSLSDGEREALSASIDRRVAAGVAASIYGSRVTASICTRASSTGICVRS